MILLGYGLYEPLLVTHETLQSSSSIRQLSNETEMSTVRNCE